MEKLSKILALAICVAFSSAAARAQDAAATGSQLIVVGASTMMQPAKDAGDILKREQNITVAVFPILGPNAQKIDFLGDKKADVALISRPITAEERAPYPGIDFHEFQFGAEAVVVVVSGDVWDGGVRSITKEQAEGIYEGKIKNWKELGGPDLAISGYTPDEKRGVWSCYVEWLYEDPTTIVDNQFPRTKSDDEARAYLGATPGCVTQVPLPYADANHLHILALKNADGKLVQPSAATVADHSYPITRQLIMVIRGRPLGDPGEFVKFMVGDRGQKIVSGCDYLTLKDLGIAPPEF